MSTDDGDPVRRALAHVAARSVDGAVDPTVRVTLNFHPDLVVAALVKDGRYRSQFETGTSNGGLTAFAGGDRWRWESRMFGAAYDEVEAEHRPVYGSLNLRHSPFGGSPRFGSSHLRLTEAALARTTFCFPDSYLEPERFGVLGRMGALPRFLECSDEPLDDYIEAQVHGPVLMERDVEALVLDPCYRGTAVEAAAAELSIATEWHQGFRLSIKVMAQHPNYRGPEYVELGRRLARDGQLDARIVGEARATGAYHPQDLKRVWHYIARFG